jgi:ABC-type glycerol-3-phosphate transport system permease component
MKEIPASLVEAARMDGAGHVRIFFRVLLPLLTPAIAAFGVFQFLWLWNDLLVAPTFAGGASDVVPLTVRVVELAGTRGSTGTCWRRVPSCPSCCRCGCSWACSATSCGDCWPAA